MDYQTLSTDWHLKDIRNKVSSRTGTEIIFKLITLQVNKSKFAFNRCSQTATVCFHLSDEKHSSLMKLTSQENQARKGDIPSFLWPKLLVFTTVANRAEWRGTIAVQSLQVQELPSPSQSRAVYLKRQTLTQLRVSYRAPTQESSPAPPAFWTGSLPATLAGPQLPLWCLFARCRGTYLPLVETGNVPRHHHNIGGAGTKLA